MRDPDLVMQAEQAAMALEHAWRHWRRRHGLAAESMLPVSSYVGYSPAEPWGQPRVVFGMAADDAAQLTLLLEGHDCVGPVYATIASLPGGQVSGPLPGGLAGDSAGSVPAMAARPRPERLRPPRRPDPLDPAQAIEIAHPRVNREAGRFGELGVPDQFGGAGCGPEVLAADQDGPVFRQAAADAAEAVAAREAAAADAVQGHAAAGGDGRAAGADGVAGQGQRSTSAPFAGRDRGTAGFRPIGRFPLPGEPAVPTQRAADGPADPDGDDPVAAGARRAGAEPPGPLALAAAAARVAAEARIRAARLDPRASADLEDPYGGSRPAWRGSGNTRRGQHEAAIYAQPRDLAAGQDTTVLDRAQDRLDGVPPAFQAPGAALPPVIPPGLLRPEAASGAVAAYLDQGPESSGFFDEAEGSAPDPDRRSRLAQFGISRSAKGRRPGTAPETA